MARQIFNSATQNLNHGDCFTSKVMMEIAVGTTIDQNHDRLAMATTTIMMPMTIVCACIVKGGNTNTDRAHKLWKNVTGH